MNNPKKTPQEKFFVIGDWVISETDGERHYVNAKSLCYLYNINPKDCILAEKNCPETLLKFKGRKPIKVLSPRADGNYCLTFKKNDI